MYEERCKDEVIIKLVGKLTLEYPDMNQLKVRDLIESVLYKYTIGTEETAIMASDIHEKVEMFLAVRKFEGKSQKTIDNNRYDLMKFADMLIKPVNQVTTADLRMYLAVRCKNLQENSTNAQITLIKTFFKWLQEEEYITQNPTLKIKRVKEPIRMRQPLSSDESVKLEDGAKTQRQKALLEFLISSGARISEVRKMNKSDINWSDKSVRVVGKGNKEREIYFSPKAKHELQKYIESRTDNCDALFVTSKGKIHRLGQRSLEKEIDKIAAQAGFIKKEKSIFPHLCRHTMATNNLNSGMNLTTLQTVMGHSVPATTLVYAKTLRSNVMHEYHKLNG